MKKLFLAMIVFLTLSGVSFGAAASSCDGGVLLGPKEDGNVLYTCTYTAAANGAIGDATVFLNGYIVRVETDPGATGPTDDALDIVIKTPTGAADITGAALQNRDATDTEIAYCKRPDGTTYFDPYAYGLHTVSYANNSVDSAVGTMYIYVSLKRP